MCAVTVSVRLRETEFMRRLVQTVGYWWCDLYWDMFGVKLKLPSYPMEHAHIATLAFSTGINSRKCSLNIAYF